MVGAGGGEEIVGFAGCDTPDLLGVALGELGLAVFLEVPDAYGLVGACCDYALAQFVEVHALDLVFVALEDECLLLAFKVYCLDVEFVNAGDN